MTPAELVVQINAPSFPGLLDTITEFALAWLVKYWWALVILAGFLYARHYRDVSRAANSRGPEVSIVALEEMVEHIGEIISETTIRLVALLFLASAGTLWLLKGFGTLVMGVGAGDPVLIGNVAAILLSVGAALGISDIRPWMVGLAFVVVVFAVFLFNQARRSVEDV